MNVLSNRSINVLALHITLQTTVQRTRHRADASGNNSHRPLSLESLPFNSHDSLDSRIHGSGLQASQAC